MDPFQSSPWTTLRQIPKPLNHTFRSTSVYFIYPTTMSAPAPDPPNPDSSSSNQANKSQDETLSTSQAPTDDDVQMKDEPEKNSEKEEEKEQVKEPEDKYEDIPDHVMSVSHKELARDREGREKAVILTIV